MQELIAKSWSAQYDSELDEASVRSTFLPAEKYLIRRYHYPSGIVINGVSSKCKCFVIRGQCRFKFDQSVQLQSGQFAELPGGSYELVVADDSDLELVKVWELPQPDPPSF
jgi:hypothetical protein